MTRRFAAAKLLFGFLVVVLLYAAPVRAQTITPTAPPSSSVTADQVNAVAHNLYCPSCQNIPLDVCPTEECAHWRAQIADLLGQGQNEQQIDQYFIDHAGMRTVGIPTDPTSRLLTVGIPSVLILTAGLLIFWQLWRWYRARGLLEPNAELETPSSTSDQETDDYRARIEAELKDKE